MQHPVQEEVGWLGEVQSGDKTECYFGLEVELWDL